MTGRLLPPAPLQASGTAEDKLPESCQNSSLHLDAPPFFPAARIHSVRLCFTEPDSGAPHCVFCFFPGAASPVKAPAKVSLIFTCTIFPFHWQYRARFFFENCWNFFEEICVFLVILFLANICPLEEDVPALPARWQKKPCRRKGSSAARHFFFPKRVFPRKAAYFLMPSFSMMAR